MSNTTRHESTETVNRSDETAHNARRNRPEPLPAWLQARKVRCERHEVGCSARVFFILAGIMQREVRALDRGCSAGCDDDYVTEERMFLEADCIDAEWLATADHFNVDREAARAACIAFVRSQKCTIRLKNGRVTVDGYFNFEYRD